MSSILIGILLAVAAFLLINRNRELLISKSIPQDQKDEIIEILMSDPAIERVIDFKSSMLDV